MLCERYRIHEAQGGRFEVLIRKPPMMNDTMFMPTDATKASSWAAGINKAYAIT